MPNQISKEIIPSSYKYHLSKLYEGYYSGYPIVKVDIDLLVATMQKMQDRLATSGLTTDGITWTLKDMNHVLTRLAQWEAEGVLKDNQDAKIFIDALKQYFVDLAALLEE